MRFIRQLLGLFFVTIGAFILPGKKKEKTKQKEVTAVITKEDLAEATPLRFTDLHSYVEQLKQSHDKFGACITISNTLISLARKKNTPIRINLSMTVKLDKTGEIGSEQKCYLSEYKSNRWRKLKDLDIGMGSIVPLVDEVIGAMGQYGWGCMDNSREQLQHYLQECIKHNQRYVLDRCAKFDITGSITIQVFIIVDVNDDVDRGGKPQPQILTKLSVKTERDSPMECAQFIYFSRKPVEIEKPAT